MATQRRSSVPTPLQLARRNAIQKGLIGGQRRWLVLGGLIWFFSITRRVLGKHPEIVSIEKLSPGQFISIRTIAPTSGKDRKALLKSTRS